MGYILLFITGILYWIFGGNIGENSLAIGLPAAIAIGSGLASIGRSVFGRSDIPDTDPRYDALINALLKRAGTGLSPEAKSAFLSRGREGIGQAVQSGRESLSRSLGRLGLLQGSAGAAYNRDIVGQGIRGQANLSRTLTELDEQTRLETFGQLLAALRGRSSAGLSRGYLALQNQPDFGTPLGLSLAALINRDRIE